MSKKPSLMTKDELYRIFVNHAKADFRIAKTAGKDTYLAGMFFRELFALNVGVDDLKPFVKDGTIIMKQISDKGTIVNVYLWAGEESRQHNVIKKILVNTGLYKPVNFVSGLLDEGIASIFYFLSWLIRRK